MAFSDSRRSGISVEGADPAVLAHDGFGVRDVVTAIIDAARADGEKWRSFEDLCDEAAAIVDSQDTLAVLPSA
ncbi:hypothetical protein LX15_000381 [Streptoalloteichus tenebrarius]|uniref:Uncharacterized protein n=1 Tax=Streptoalloteichus tenebrarius (strain ATCC 17920 / DSM 40477 / JCM 4838 / CBS 697.72 / NBRC 16177 / NCIMB 11028 / NRRL B-12390 / A12253. 1 / ISP 5477) TaxID=1933 RepID=A0ABT1HMF5_STRSD|nr:hypothetical protein [Streptoalloteichus tenebrarius]MCP2256698.1 hypothetical protein [Streptoalloteichus tenebrarius]BFF00402.1 hypothetical protein GCM10020241_20770 [Streptoalloteichus tenebrarius]